MLQSPLGWSFWSRIPPNLTWRLLLIIVFLGLIAMGNIFSAYDRIINNDMTTALYAAISVLFYAIPAYGLFKLKTWARTFELIFSFILVGLGLVMLIFDSIISGLFIITTHGFVAVYLLSNECKKAIGLKS